MTDLQIHEIQMQNYRTAVKFQNSFRQKAKRRFAKIFTEADLNGLTAKADVSTVCFEILNRFGNWHCEYWISAEFNSDRTEIVGILFHSQSTDYPEMPQFLVNKKQQIIDIFTELYFSREKGEKELAEKGVFM
jgi:hypothetical protein